MIATLFKRRPKTSAPAAPRTPDGAVVWAIGDVHGRLDLLEPLVEAILSDARHSPTGRRTVVFLGDYVDRGPDSRGVLKYLSRLQQDSSLDWRFLKGNHEEAMLDFLEDPSAGVRWCQYGGDATLASYGLKPPNLQYRIEGWAGLSADLDHKLSRKERAFLEGLELSFSAGDYFFAHAGARPGESLERQTSRDLMWIRNSFLDSEVEFDKVVVHGHTPTREVYADRRRIGIDTRAYDSGVLSALRLEGGGQDILKVFEDGQVALTPLKTSSPLYGPADGLTRRDLPSANQKGPPTD